MMQNLTVPIQNNGQTVQVLDQQRVEAMMAGK